MFLIVRIGLVDAPTELVERWWEVGFRDQCEMSLNRFARHRAADEAGDGSYRFRVGGELQANLVARSLDDGGAARKRTADDDEIAALIPLCPFLDVIDGVDARARARLCRPGEIIGVAMISLVSLDVLADHIGDIRDLQREPAVRDHVAGASVEVGLISFRELARDEDRQGPVRLSRDASLLEIRHRRPGIRGRSIPYPPVRARANEPGARRRVPVNRARLDANRLRDLVSGCLEQARDPLLREDPAGLSVVAHGWPFCARGADRPQPLSPVFRRPPATGRGSRRRAPVQAAGRREARRASRETRGPAAGRQG